MIWIVSNLLISTAAELENRQKYIREVTGASVSSWKECQVQTGSLRFPQITYYRCISDRGEHGFVITAHMNLEVQCILKRELTQKRALVAINSCCLKQSIVEECRAIIKAKNPESEVRFAKQDITPTGFKVNYIDDVGTFGFSTTLSEREIYQFRNEGLIKAIRKAFLL